MGIIKQAVPGGFSGIVWDMFSAALPGENAQYTGRQAGEWPCCTVS